jgi:hypothetical protein
MAFLNILCTWVGPIGKGMAAFIFFGLTFFLKILVILPPFFSSSSSCMRLDVTCLLLEMIIDWVLHSF